MSVSDGRHPLTPRQIKRRDREAAKPERRLLHYTRRGGALVVADYHAANDRRVKARKAGKIARASRRANRS